MARFEVTGPDGHKYEITAPDQDAALAAFHRLQAGESDPSAQQRYNEALGKVRQSQFPDMTDQQWQEYSQRAFAPDLHAQGQQSTTLGFGDEISAAMGGLGSQLRQWTGGGGGGFGEAYGDLYELEQARLELARKNNGGLGTAVEVAGGLAALGPARSAAGALMAPGASAAGSTLGARATNAFKSAPAILAPGAVYGFGSTDGNLGQRAVGAGVGTSVGAAGAGAAALGGKVIQGTARRIAQGPLNRANKASLAQAVANAPAATAIKGTSKAAYKAAESTGATISQPAMQILAHDMDQLARLQGLVLPSGKLSTAFPKVAHAIRSVREYARGPMTLEQGQTLLRTLRAAQNSKDPNEARLGSTLVNQFEDFLDGLPPSAFSENGAKSGEAIKQWAKGRTEWARAKRVETIENIVADARLARGNFAQNLRNGFAKILKSNAAKKRRGFSAAELAAIDRFVEGGPLQDLLQRLGASSGLPGGLLGGVTGGPVGAVAVPAMGWLAKGAANNAARRGAELLRAQVASPGGLPTMQALPAPLPIPRIGASGGVAANATLGDQRDFLTRRLAAAGG